MESARTRALVNKIIMYVILVIMAFIMLMTFVSIIVLIIAGI